MSAPSVFRGLEGRVHFMGVAGAGMVSLATISEPIAAWMGTSNI